MKKRSDKMSDELRPEYDLRQLLKAGVRGKYAKRYVAGTNLILLGLDIRKAFSHRSHNPKRGGTDLGEAQGQMPQETVGRTPSSARVPPDPLFASNHQPRTVNDARPGGRARTRASAPPNRRWRLAIGKYAALDRGTASR